MKKTRIITDFRCPYNNINCPFIDATTMTISKLCDEDCKYYHNGVKQTGGMPELEKLVNFIKSLFNKK